MADFGPLAVMTAALGLGIGQYVILSSYLDGKFVQRYSVVKKVFRDWQEQAKQESWQMLRKKATQEKPPEDIQSFVDEWISNGTIVELWEQKYRDLDWPVNFVLLGSFVSFVTGVFAMIWPEAVLTNLSTSSTSTTPVHWVEISIFLFAVAGVFAFFYVSQHRRISRVISEFEIDPSEANLKRIIERLVQERERKSVST